MIRHVQQEDANGCLVACIAMVTGRTYREIAAMVTPEQIAKGLYEIIVDNVLDELGYAVARRYLHVPRLNAKREAWPCAPFAPVHVAGVVTPRGGHGVVMLDDGRVLDPWDGPRADLSGYAKVHYIAGVFPKVAATERAA